MLSPPPSPAEAFRQTTSIGANAVESTHLFNEGLSEGVVEEIKKQKASGDFRTIAGRPWWASTYSAEELKNAGLT